MSITLRTHSKQPGYQVTVEINRRRINRFFGTGRYLTLEHALKRAERYQRALHYIAKKARMQRRKTPGEPGIYRYLRADYKNGKTYTYDTIQAVWREQGKLWSTSFSVDKHGEEGAMELARQAIGVDETLIIEA